MRYYFNNEGVNVIYIKNPKTNKKTFLDNSLTKYEDRLEQINERILKNPDYMNYFKSNTFIKNNSQMFSYYNNEDLLERCATFLLRGQYKKNNIMTIFNIRNAQVNEIPVSLANGNAQDLMYSDNGNLDDVQNQTINASATLIAYEKKNTHKNKKTFKKSNTYKLSKLYSTKPIRTYKISQVFYKDNENKKKPLKNAWGENIYDAVEVTIRGNKGIIEGNHNSTWSYVDVNNEFLFNGSRYIIDKSLKQYDVKNSSLECDYFTNESEMEKILCYYISDSDKFHFFDEEINEITEFITQV